MAGQDGAGWASPSDPWLRGPAAPQRPDAARSPWDVAPQPLAQAPAWSGPGWGPAAPPPAGTNAWAVVALVTGLLALVPVAVVAGIIGLVQTGRRRQAGRWLAAGGLVAAGLWTVGIVVTIAVVADSWAPLDTRLGRVDHAGSTTVGQCVSAPPDGAAPWRTADCTQPHDGEVYLVHTLGGDAWPGQDVVDSRADDACHQEFSAYVGRSYLTSTYDYAWFGPNSAEWSAGERRAVCVVIPFDDDVLREPVRGSGD